MQDRETALKNALRELTAIVRGECPSLLNEDSGGNGELSYEIDTLLASPLSAPPQEPTVAAQLIADDVEWVVNDNAELGVKIGRQFFFCYKGHSLVYDTGTHDDGTPMMWRPVFKREFGECIHPVNYANPTHIGTVSLADSDQWKPLPISPHEPTGASPQAETGEASVVAAIARHRMLHSDAWSTGFVAALGCCADDLPDEIVAIRPNRADLPDAKAYRRVYRRGFTEALARAAALVEAAVERTIAEFKLHPAPVSPVKWCAHRSGAFDVRTPR